MSQQTHPSAKRSILYKAIPRLTGIRTIWDWSELKQKYVQRQFGKKYYGYKKVNGRQFTKCFDSLQEAKAWWCDPLLVEKCVLQVNQDLTFRELREKFLEHYVGRVRISSYETFCSQITHLSFFDEIRVIDINPRVVDAWLNALKQPKYLRQQNTSRLTYLKQLTGLGQILNYYRDYLCEDQNYGSPIKPRHREDCIINHDKYHLAKERNRKRFLSEREIDLFLSFMAKEAGLKPKMRVFFLMALAQLRTGARIGEVCALRWEDVDWSNGIATIHQAVLWSRRKGRDTIISPLTKTNTTRTVVLMEDLLQELKKWRMACGRGKGLIFSESPTIPVNYRSVQHRYDLGLKAIGVDWRATHILRHSFATDFLAKTSNLTAVQGMLGHKTQAQTSHYAKITNTVLKQGMSEYAQALATRAR